VVDVTAPTAALAAPAGLVGPLSVAFSEPVAGASAATVALRIAGATAGLPATVACTATSCTVQPAKALVAGQQYELVLAAGITDTAGNTLAPATLPFRAALAHEESAPGAVYRWRSSAAAPAYGGSYAVERAPGARASFTFTGTSFTWWTVAARSQGLARVYVDGVYKGTVSNYASSTRWKVARTYAGLANAAHTVDIVVAGARASSSATDTQVIIDAVTVAGRLIASPGLTHAWGARAVAGASGSRVLRSDFTGATASFAFRGTSVTWVTARGKEMGKARIYVDGVLQATVDNYANVPSYGVARRITGLTDAVHTVKVVVLGTKATFATGRWVVVDRWVVA
jgi:hypothetical protein